MQEDLVRVELVVNHGAFNLDEAVDTLNENEIHLARTPGVLWFFRSGIPHHNRAWVAFEKGMLTSRVKIPRFTTSTYHDNVRSCGGTITTSLPITVTFDRYHRIN